MDAEKFLCKAHDDLAKERACKHVGPELGVIAVFDRKRIVAPPPTAGVARFGTPER